MNIGKILNNFVKDDILVSLETNGDKVFNFNYCIKSCKYGLHNLSFVQSNENTIPSIVISYENQVEFYRILRSMINIIEHLENNEITHSVNVNYDNKMILIGIKNESKFIIDMSSFSIKSN